MYFCRYFRSDICMIYFSFHRCVHVSHVYSFVENLTIRALISRSSLIMCMMSVIPSAKYRILLDCLSVRSKINLRFTETNTVNFLVQKFSVERTEVVRNRRQKRPSLPRDCSSAGTTLPSLSSLFRITDSSQQHYKGIHLQASYNC